MKKCNIVIILLIALLLPTMGWAQKSVPHGRRMYTLTPIRTEIILPQVNGYNCYKADLHTHTIYSDGEQRPLAKVMEAWADGMDIIAITDHLEARTYERRMLKALAGYNADGKPHTYSHAGAVKKKPDNTGIRSDLNVAFREAARAAGPGKSYPEMLVIRGVEIGREPTQMGHFNALFIKDIQAVYDLDIMESFRKVKEQGGILIHNHPAYRRKTTDKSEWQKGVYDAKIFDGVEIVNGSTFYPKMVRRCIEENLIMVAATDSHRPTNAAYDRVGVFRTHTIILAKENTQDAIKEALLARRTMGYCGGHVIGEEQMLLDLFHASVECKSLGLKKIKGKWNGQFRLTNNSSIPYTIVRRGITLTLEPFKSITISVPEIKGKIEYKYAITNMWHMDEKHPTITLSHPIPEVQTENK